MIKLYHVIIIIIIATNVHVLVLPLLILVVETRPLYGVEGWPYGVWHAVCKCYDALPLDLS